VSAHHVQVIPVFVVHLNIALLMENVNNVLTTATVELLLLTAKAIPALRVQFLLPFAHQNIQIRLNNVRLMEVVFVVQQMLIAQERILLTAKITSATHV